MLPGKGKQRASCYKNLPTKTQRAESPLREPCPLRLVQPQPRPPSGRGPPRACRCWAGTRRGDARVRPAPAAPSATSGAGGLELLGGVRASASLHAAGHQDLQELRKTAPSDPTLGTQESSDAGRLNGLPDSHGPKVFPRAGCSQATQGLRGGRRGRLHRLPGVTTGAGSSAPRTPPLGVYPKRDHGRFLGWLRTRNDLREPVLCSRERVLRAFTGRARPGREGVCPAWPGTARGNENWTGSTAASSGSPVAPPPRRTPSPLRAFRAAHLRPAPLPGPAAATRTNRGRRAQARSPPGPQSLRARAAGQAHCAMLAVARSRRRPERHVPRARPAPGRCRRGRSLAGRAPPRAPQPGLAFLPPALPPSAVGMLGRLASAYSDQTLRLHAVLGRHHWGRTVTAPTWGAKLQVTEAAATRPADARRPDASAPRGPSGQAWSPDARSP